MFCNLIGVWKFLNGTRRMCMIPQTLSLFLSRRGWRARLIQTPTLILGRNVIVRLSHCPSMEMLRKKINVVLKKQCSVPILTRPCGCGGTGWRRAAYLNKSDPRLAHQIGINTTITPVLCDMEKYYHSRKWIRQ